MPADQPRGPNRAWKNQAGAPDRAGAGKRAWQKAPEAPTGPKRPLSKKSKLGMATFAVSAIIALMIGVVLYLRPAKPACLVLIGAGFEEELAVPHNVYGWKGLEDVATLASSGGVESWLPWSGSGPLRLQSGPREHDPKQPWVPRTFAEETVVVFLAFNGGSDRKSAYLVVNDPKGPRHVALEQILDEFAAPELKEKKKLLILDATQAAAHWPSGLLHNDFVRRLKELDKRIEQIDKLVVLCSSDVDQRSWVSEEWRQTIFTHYVIEGLKGEADSDGNSRVTALELAQYVQNRVPAWTQANRDAVQRPLLLPTQGGEERARAMELVQNPEPYRERGADQAPGRNFQIPSELQPAWEEWSHLRTQVPSPAVYTPQLWRRYQDTLLRYEQLQRAGDPTRKAGHLRANLSRLKDRIVAGRRLEHVTDSVPYALPMAAEVGLTGPWPREDLKNQFKDLWTAKPEKRQEVWLKLTDWAKGQGDAKDETLNRKLLQVELTRLLLEQVTQGPPASRQDLDKAVDLQRLVESGGPRPVEAHYLVMLLRDLDSNPKLQPPPADLRQALEISRLAENTAAGRTRADAAHPYSEVVLPWIEGAVVKADERRRHGQDLLFGPAAKWDDARSDLREARTAYQKAGQNAEAVRQALAIRDQVLAALPYYARWLAVQQASGGDGPDALPVRELLTRVEELARSVDSLAGPLESTERRQRDIDTLKSLSEEVKGNFAYLTGEFDQKSQQLSKQQEHQLRYLPRFEAALAVPLIDDPALRMVLLGKSRELSAKFNAAFDPASKSNKPGAEAAVAGEALESAKRQGRMAVAVTGLAERWLDAANAVQIRGLVNNLQAGQWHDDIAMIGEGVAGRYQQMRERIDKGLGESVQANKLETAVAKIQGPEYLCRVISGGQVPTEPVEPFDAVEASRRLRFHDLLLWQAQRTLDDHWFKDSANPLDTYYEPAARAYVKDAEEVARAGKDEDRDKSRQALALAKKRSIIAARLLADGPPSQHVTSEREFRVGWKVSAQKGLPTGVPVFWLEVDGPIKTLQATDLGRKPLVDALPMDLAFTLQKVGESKEKDPSLAADVKEAKAMLRGVFRGQRIMPDTTLYLHKAPEIIVYRTPPPDAGGVSLRLERGFTYGAVSIVLDCSGSMNGLVGGRKKIDLAREALARVLRKIPKGTYLSIAAFGQDPQLQVEPKSQLEATKIRWVRKVDAWDPEDMDDGIEVQVARLNRLVPQNLSPITESLKFAKEEGFPAETKYKGPRVILALTDGDDNLFEEGYSVKYAKEELFGQGQRVPKYLDKEFRDSGIEVNVICFADKNSQVKEAREEAENAERQFGGVKTFDPPGRFLLLPDPAALEKALEQAIRPRLRLFQGGSIARKFPRDGVLATAYAENLLWKPVDLSLETRGFYNGRVQSIYRQDVEIARGQLLNVTLKRDGRQVLFERGLLYDFVKDTEGAKSKGEWYYKRDAWTVSVPQNQFVQANGQLRQLVAIESGQRGQSGVPLQQVEPKFVWMELKAQGAKKPPSFLWHNEFGYPAPVFRLSAPLWPASAGDPAAPEVDVWWSENPTPGESRSVSHAPGPLAGLQGQVINLPGNPVTLTTVKADRTRTVTVATQGDLHEQAVKPCLVVEIDHEAGKPVWVRPDGLGHQGEEHLFYTSSGKYTAIFWGVSDPDARAFQLTVISLDDFKKTAATNRHALFRLSPPDPVDNGPPRMSLKSLE